MEQDRTLWNNIFINEIMSKKVNIPDDIYEFVRQIGLKQDWSVSKTATNLIKLQLKNMEK